jgi:TatD family-associated radical SAM protein
MKGNIAYRFETPAYPGNILYVNLVERYSCTNDCIFCSRPRTLEEVGKTNIYEKKAGSFLFLEKSPSADEVMESIDAKIREDDAEVAIIGLGEPLIQLPTVEEVVRRTKERYGVRTRVDTNGSVGCIYENACQRLAEAGLDEIRISLNAVNAQEYDALCRPRFENAYEKLVKFIGDCLKEGIDTKVSFVVGFENDKIKTRSAEEYKEYALSLGVKPENVIIREYVAPIGKSS